MRLAYLATWVLFVLATLALGWDGIRVYQVLVLIIGYVGTCMSGGWVLRGEGWMRASMIASVAMVLSYLLWWSVEISIRYSADAAPGLMRTVLAQFQIATGLLGERLRQSEYLIALAEGYWLLGMPMVQLAFAIVIGRQIGRMPVEPRAAVVK